MLKGSSPEEGSHQEETALAQAGLVRGRRERPPRQGAACGEGRMGQPPGQTAGQGPGRAEHLTQVLSGSLL